MSLRSRQNWVHPPRHSGRCGSPTKARGHRIYQLYLVIIVTVCEHGDRVQVFIFTVWRLIPGKSMLQDLGVTLVWLRGRGLKGTSSTSYLAHREAGSVDGDAGTETYPVSSTCWKSNVQRGKICFPPKLSYLCLSLYDSCNPQPRLSSCLHAQQCSPCYYSLSRDDVATMWRTPWQRIGVQVWPSEQYKFICKTSIRTRANRLEITSLIFSDLQSVASRWNQSISTISTTPTYCLDWLSPQWRELPRRSQTNPHGISIPTENCSYKLPASLNLIVFENLQGTRFRLSSCTYL